jgi:hypothetical protein
VGALTCTKGSIGTDVIIGRRIDLAPMMRSIDDAMSKIVPLISSGIAGPLGVLHLPRLWLKVSLDARGKLADGYPAVGTGFDQMVIDGLNLKRDAVISFISEKRPNYTQFEQWVRQQPGATLDKASVDKLNQAIAGYNHDDETRHLVLGAADLADDNKAPHDAVNLNNLDDWTEFHQAELK